MVYSPVLTFCRRNDSVLIYEIYPQNESPQPPLTQIANSHFALSRLGILQIVTYHLLHYKLIHYEGRYEDKIFFVVRDYRMNYSIRFWGDVDDRTSAVIRSIPIFGKHFPPTNQSQIIAIALTIILLCRKEMIVPPLSPQSLDFLDHALRSFTTALQKSMAR